MSDVNYAELAQQTKHLANFRTYRADAETRRDEAIAEEEEENIRRENGRIETTETRIRELVAELGLA